ncbi:Transposable element Tcb1 transposase, partial [Stegodyphus mimosarum]
MIIGFRAKGGSISETAEFVNCSRAAVVKVYRAWQNGTVQNQRRGKCGAPRAIDDRGERRLRRCVRADRRATVEQLTTKMNQGATKSVSQSTIQRTLLRLGLRSRRLVRAPMLTAVHRRRRLEFARQYSSWTSTEWRQVAFSDESRFMLHRTDGRWRIRRETSERNHPATIAGTVQAGGGSIMVWGMFSWHSLGSLIIVEGTMDQYKYASVLADHVHPYMRIVFPQDDGIFQQDNARCHTAASVRAWFEEHQDEFTVLPWPANSPDLNPIEHLWDHLDRVVRAMDPQPRNLAQLATALESAWLNIPENTFRDLCDSLPARLAAVRSAKATISHDDDSYECEGFQILQTKGEVFQLMDFLKKHGEVIINEGDITEVFHCDDNCPINNQLMDGEICSMVLDVENTATDSKESDREVIENQNILIANVCKEYNIKRHYDTKHSTFSKLQGEDQNRKIKFFRHSLVAQRNVFTKASSQLDSCVEVSLGIAALIAKSGCPFTDGDFAKECILLASKKVCPEAMQKLKNLSLSRMTIQRIIENLSEDVTEQLQNAAIKFKYFSLAADESTGITSTAQLLLFVRGISGNFEVTEELVGMSSMKGRTTGADILSSVLNLCSAHNFDINKLVSITTDGAPAMIRIQNGVVSLLRKHLGERGKDLLGYHCIIHQEQLCVKELGFDRLMKVINPRLASIRNSALDPCLSRYLVQLQTYCEKVPKGFEKYYPGGKKAKNVERDVSTEKKEEPVQETPSKSSPSSSKPVPPSDWIFKLNFGSGGQKKGGKNPFSPDDDNRVIALTLCGALAFFSFLLYHEFRYKEITWKEFVNSYLARNIELEKEIPDKKSVKIKLVSLERLSVEFNAFDTQILNSEFSSNDEFESEWAINLIGTVEDCGPVVSLQPGPWVEELRQRNIHTSDVGRRDLKIEVLIVADVAGALLTRRIQKLENGLTAALLGWAIMGKINDYISERNSLSLSMSSTVTSMLIHSSDIENLLEARSIGNYRC